MTSNTILVNLKRCTGCWTCAMACKVGNDTPEGKWWLYVRTLGDGSGIDEPAGVWPDLQMSWMPIFTKNCMLCVGRTARGDDPFCVYNCPAKALTYGDLNDPQSDISQRLDDLKDKSFRTWHLPTFEGTLPEIIYADL